MIQKTFGNMSHHSFESSIMFVLVLTMAISVNSVRHQDDTLKYEQRT